MKIELTLTSGQNATLPTGYNVYIQRSDEAPVDRLEAFTVLQTALDAVCTGIEDSFGNFHAQVGVPEE